MKWFEKIQNEMTVEELAQFLDSILAYDATPWSRYFQKEFCDKCEPILGTLPGSSDPEKEHEFAPCELKNEDGTHNNPCGYANCFPVELVKLWLNSEVETT